MTDLDNDITNYRLTVDRLIAKCHSIRARCIELEVDNADLRQRIKENNERLAQQEKNTQKGRNRYEGARIVEQVG